LDGWVQPVDRNDQVIDRGCIVSSFARIWHCTDETTKTLKVHRQVTSVTLKYLLSAATWVKSVTVTIAGLRIYWLATCHVHQASYELNRLNEMVLINPGISCNLLNLMASSVSDPLVLYLFSLSYLSFFEKL
jgi:hypothetical protein